ncbi:MAG: PHP domain-containing protein [Lachnospiraceae bacterium]|nr:PHP domain-containing protein [Lachnospiraceae bacterium]
MNIIDLHVHSNKSDGSMSPSELVAHALQKGLSAFALTDHDTIDGLSEAILALREVQNSKSTQDSPCCKEVIPGIEFSTEYLGRDVHILGLYIDFLSETFQQRLVEFVDARDLRNKKMCDKLREEGGIDITYEKLVSEFPDAVITRSQFAQYLYKHGVTKSIKEGFSDYVGDHCKYFIPREKVTPMQATELILNAGGIPILAHPVLYGFGKDTLDKLTCELKEAGLIGIEAIYCTYTNRDEWDIRNLAEKYDLCISGGSDFHGSAKPGLELGTGYGKLIVPESVLTELKKHLPRHSKFRTQEILFDENNHPYWSAITDLK